MFFCIFSCKKKQELLYDEDISLAKVYLKKKLSIGISIPFPPMAFYSGNNLSGFDIEVLEEVCDRLEIKSDFVVIDWSQKLDLLESNKIDVLASGFGLTPERVGVYLMTRPIVQNAQVLVVNGESNNINYMKDLSGKKIGVQTDSTAASIIEGLLKSGFNCEVIHSDDVYDEVLALKEKKIDAMIIDLLVINSYIHEKGFNFKILSTTLQEEKYVFAFRIGDNALKEEIEKVLEEMAKDGTLEKITRKWFYANISLIR